MSSSSHRDPIMRLLDENDDHPQMWPEKNVNPYDLNSKIMLIAIISLSVVVVLVVLLHTYARCVLRRQTLRRAAALRRLGSTVAHIHSTAEPPKTGLEPSVIAALPVFVYGEGRHEGDADVECAVCLSMLEDEEMARLLPNCKHSFHAECIDTWLSSHTTCPICRTEAEPRLAPQPEPREGPVANAAPTAPPLDQPVISVLSCAEGTSEDGKAVNSGSISRLSSSFRRMLSRDRSSRRVQPSGQDDFEDLERQ